MSKKDVDPDAPVAVIGLGRFGTSVASSLVRLGHEVLGIDSDMALVQRWSDELTHVVQADSTDEDALRQVGVEQFDRAVVGIGSDIEASVLTVLTLVEMGVGDVWAKAITRQHGRILERVGATHVVYPESAMGERVAHLVTGAMIDYIELDGGFALARTLAPPGAVGRSIADSALGSQQGITVVGVKRRGEGVVHAGPDTVIGADDQLIVSGPASQVERFSATTRPGRT